MWVGANKQLGTRSVQSCCRCFSFQRGMCFSQRMQRVLVFRKWVEGLVRGDLFRFWKGHVLCSTANVTLFNLALAICRGSMPLDACHMLIVHVSPVGCARWYPARLGSCLWEVWLCVYRIPMCLWARQPVFSLIWSLNVHVCGLYRAHCA